MYHQKPLQSGHCTATKSWRLSSAVISAVCVLAYCPLLSASDAAGIPVFPNFNADTVDGVIFTTAADRKSCHAGDSLRIRYHIANRTMGSVLYDFGSTCQLSFELCGSDGKTLFSGLSRGLPSVLLPDSCETMPSQMLLAPSADKLLGPVVVPLTLKNSDTLSVKAHMTGYPLSTVTVRVLYSATPAAAGPVALEWTAENRPELEFNSETKMLIIRVNRAQKLSISAFILTGQKINKLSCERFLTPGTHQISFNNPKLADGVVIFKVEGAGFSETKTINLAR